MAILEFTSKPPAIFDQIPHLFGIYRWNDTCRSMHSHPDLVELNFMAEGNGTHIVNNELCYTQRGDILICNSNIMHDETLLLKTKINMCCIAMTGLKVSGLPPNTLLPPDLHPVIPSGSAYTDLCQLYDMAHRYSHHAENYDLANALAQSILFIVYDLIRQHTTPIRGKESQLIKKMQNYINIHYKEDLTLPKLSQVFHISEYYIAHLFRGMTNYAPMNYVIRRRIGEAQTLLIYTDQDIASIAAQVGYPDSNYFSRIFKKTVGLSPRQYRREWRSQIPGR